MLGMRLMGFLGFVFKHVAESYFLTFIISAILGVELGLYHV